MGSECRAFFHTAAAAQLLFLLSAFGASGCPVSESDDPCVNNPCQEWGTCAVTSNRGFVCDCPEGTSGDQCEINPDECENHACVNGVCVDSLGEYNCVCDPGFTGTLCDELRVPPDPVTAELSLDVSMDDLPSWFDTAFSRDIGRALGLPTTAVMVMSKSAGSVIVTFSIAPNQNFNVTGNGGWAYDPRDKLEELADMVKNENSKLFTQRNNFINAERLKPAHNRALVAADGPVPCMFYLERIHVCNGKTDSESVCGDMNCRGAMDDILKNHGRVLQNGICLTNPVPFPDAMPRSQCQGSPARSTTGLPWPDDDRLQSVWVGRWDSLCGGPAPETPDTIQCVGDDV